MDLPWKDPVQVDYAKRRFAVEVETGGPSLWKGGKWQYHIREVTSGN